MDDNFLKLKEMVLRSSLEFPDKAELLLAFVEANEEIIRDMVELCTEDPAWVITFSENLRAKQAAVVTQDAALWEHICKEEARQLATLPD